LETLCKRLEILQEQTGLKLLAGVDEDEEAVAHSDGSGAPDLADHSLEYLCAEDSMEL
jgi:hypothetical protein